MIRVKPKVIFHIGTRFIKNEILRKLSILLDTYLLPPPNFIEIRLTLRCNLKCLQCCWWQIKSPVELSTELWKKIILDIKDYIGPYFLRFYGGEPFCRSDLLELINFCFHNDIATLITTNGTFIEQSVAYELAKNKVVLINISLDGFKAETHDKLRGVKGTYQKVMRAIECLQGKVPVQINTTIMDGNLDEILDLSEFACKNKLQISFQGYSATRYKIKSPAFKIDNHFFPRDLKKLDYIIDELCRRKKYNKSIVDSYVQLERLKLYYHHSPKLKKKYCEAIGARLMIKERGNITLCSQSGPIGSIGNLVENSLRDIWKSKIAFEKNKKMKKCEVTDCLVNRGCYKESYLEKIAKAKRYIFE